MSEPSKNDPQIFPQPYPSAACDIFNCRTRAKWFIGKPNPVGTWNLCLRVCDECMKKILSAIPEELQQYLPGYSLLQDNLKAANQEIEQLKIQTAELERKLKKKGAGNNEKGESTPGGNQQGQSTQASKKEGAKGLDG